MTTNPAKAEKAIVMFGDSITFQGNWEALLKRSDVANRGQPGYTTGQLNWTIKDVFDEHHATKIWFLQGGVNDISLGVPIQRILENQQFAIDALQNKQILPVVQATTLKRGDPEFNKLVRKLNKNLKKLCTRSAVEYLDVNAFLSRDGELIQSFTEDGCHLTADAYIPWGKAINTVLARHVL